MGQAVKASIYCKVKFRNPKWCALIDCSVRKISSIFFCLVCMRKSNRNQQRWLMEPAEVAEVTLTADSLGRRCWPYDIGWNFTWMMRDKNEPEWQEYGVICIKRLTDPGPPNILIAWIILLQIIIKNEAYIQRITLEYLQKHRSSSSNCNR